jgi:plastocyanin
LRSYIAGVNPDEPYAAPTIEVNPGDTVDITLPNNRFAGIPPSWPAGSTHSQDLPILRPGIFSARLTAAPQFAKLTIVNTDVNIVRRRAMPNWLIKIVPVANPTPEVPAAFIPDLKDAKPGTPLTAQVDDIVVWSNRTNEAHWPWPVDADGNRLPDNQVPPGLALSDAIPANTPSNSYDVTMPATGNTIDYCCKLHPKMRGQITVTAIPKVSPSA